MPVVDSKPDIRSEAYDAMFVYWDLPIDLRGGTPAMRAARTKYLPLEEDEKDPQYEVRLELATLFAAYDDTIQKLASRPFSKPVVIENSSPELDYIESNCDGDGTTLTDFSENLIDSQIDLGLTYILVDFSKITENEGGSTATKKQEKDAGARVFFIHYKADNVIWWNIDDQGTLTEVRFLDAKMVDGIRVELVKVWFVDSWEVWQKVPKKEQKEEHWIIINQGVHTFGRIPLVVVYAKRTGRMTARPPMYGLADENLAHWRTRADYRSALRFGMFGIIFIKGVDPNTKVVIGPGSTFKTKNEKAEMSHIEHTGKSIAAGLEELVATEHRMQVLGLQPLVKSGGRDTATGKSIDESRNRSPLQRWARTLEEGLEECYVIAAEWHKIQLLDDFQVTIFKEFALNAASAENTKLLLESCKAGKLSNKTYLKELKRYGALNDQMDVDEEIATVQEEFAVLSSVLNDDEQELTNED